MAALLEGHSRRSVVVGRLVDGEGVEEEEAPPPATDGVGTTSMWGLDGQAKTLLLSMLADRRSWLRQLPGLSSLFRSSD